MTIQSTICIAPGSHKAAEACSMYMNALSSNRVIEGVNVGTFGTSPDTTEPTVSWLTWAPTATLRARATEQQIARGTEIRKVVEARALSFMAGWRARFFA